MNLYLFQDLDEESRYYLFGLNFGLNVDVEYPAETKSCMLIDVLPGSCSTYRKLTPTSRHMP